MVWRVLIIVLLALCQTSFAYAQKRVEYYVHTKTYYKNGTVTTEPGTSGQFITRNGQVCYDSNRDGFSVDNGSLQLKIQQGSTSKYVGSCYYKGECSYTFYDDRGVLNIEDILGNVYVYKRQTPAAHITTSSLIKERPKSEVIIVNPTTTTPSQKIVPCGVCHETGKCSSCYGKGISPHHAPGIIVQCGACGGTGKCTTCKGMGHYQLY